MPFTQKSLDFLFENRLHDSKEWFAQHKQEYKTYVIEPFSELINELAPTMMGIDKLIICDPKRISRIYRDARYARDSVFRDSVWYTFARQRTSAYDEHAGFYFSIGAGMIGYGCGYYCADSGVRDAVRAMILSDDVSYKAAFSAVGELPHFSQYGELYKKNHFPDQPPEKCDWLNRREFGFSFQSGDAELMFSRELAKRVAEDFERLAPLYDFYIKAEQLAKIKQGTEDT